MSPGFPPKTLSLTQHPVQDPAWRLGVMFSGSLVCDGLSVFVLHNFDSFEAYSIDSLQNGPPCGCI